MHKKPYFTSLKEAIQTILGSNALILAQEPVTGGAINQAFRLTINTGDTLFMKTNHIKNLNFFHTEITGLECIHATHTIGAPTPLAYGIDQTQNISFLLTNFLTPSTTIPDWVSFGHALATMHKANTSSFVQGGTYGFLEDNYIGSMPQINTPYDSWVDFFLECRLKPQFEWADHYFTDEEKEHITTFYAIAKELLVEPQFPSLLHGDLWFGNAMIGPDGKMWLIDPGAYIGHYEAELAMTALYGGFDDAFYQAYYEILPKEDGYEKRRDIYNLYHTVNHLNIFGTSYLNQTKHIIQKYLLLYR